MISSMKRNLNQQPIRQSMYTSSGVGAKASSIFSKKEDNRKCLRAPVQLFDANGIDCTPLSLLSDEKKLKDGERDAHSEIVSQGSIYTQSISSFIVTNPLQFTRSKSQQSSSGFTAESSSTLSDDINENTAQNLTAYTEIKLRPETIDNAKRLDLDNMVDIYLEETETMWIFDQEPELYVQGTEESGLIEKKNKEYELLLNSRIGNDKYVERGMNTFENSCIGKAVQTMKIGHANMACSATEWDIYDLFKEMEEKEKNLAERPEVSKDENLDINVSPNATTGDESRQKTILPTQDVTLTKSLVPTKSIDKNPDSISAHTESELFGTRQSSGSPSSVLDSQAKIEEILNSNNLAYSAFVLERTLNMNYYFKKMLFYRDLPYFKELMKQLNAADIKVSLSDEDSDQQKRSSTQKSLEQALSKPLLFVSDKPYLELLWKFSNVLCKGRNISSIAWNKQNPDILAVGYGEFEYNQPKPGLVCCWSLKNIEYPERMISLSNRVTAISWSKAHSNLLAVGLFDGTICVYDLRRKTNESIVDTKHTKGRHIGPVRQLEWIIRASGRSEENSEVLISISSDGKITQWSVRKGFESADLMKLKRVATKIPIASKQKKTDALISQYAAGTCFDFNTKDKNIYLAGVEEGNIHKCSCSYNEQYLDTFFGHSAPVYSIKWSPFVSEVFLSCSADWSIKLWHVERTAPVLNIQNNVRAVNSISWSPKSSVVFACVNESMVEVWNLSVSTLDPIIAESITPDSVLLSTVTFTDTGNCLLVGDSEGVVHTFALKNMPEAAKNQAEALDRTIQSCIASQL